MAAHPLISVDEAQQQLLTEMSMTPAMEQVDYLSALGRVIAEAPVSQINVPPCDNSSMDGYAVHTDDLSDTEQTPLIVSQRICAGDGPTTLERGTCARIFTGASMPQGANAVVIQENVTLEGDKVLFPSGVPSGANVRPCGQDIAQGTEVFPVGHKITPVDVGVLASCNLTQVSVFAPLRIAIVSTGSELVEPGQVAAQGQIYNSNGALLTSLLAQVGITQVAVYQCKDSLKETLALFSRLSGTVDAIISTGGVSVGEEDYVKAALTQLGRLDLWKIKLKPGKPLAYGRLGDTPFFGLPGNPASALITFLLFVKPCLDKLSGAKVLMPTPISLPAAFERTKANSRQEYLRVRVQDGRLFAHANQSSGMLSSSSWATGLAIIAPNQRVELGDLVSYVSFNEWFLS